MTKTETVERRYLKAVKGRELRADVGADGTVKICGYAAVFNSESENLGGFRETIVPGAFADVLTDDCRFLINHEDLPIARTTSGNLVLKEDNVGLYIEATCDPSDPDVQRIIPKMKRGDLDQMSFAFELAEGGDTWNPQPAEDGLWRRAITKFSRLLDVSIVTYPAYPQTQVALRSLELLKKAAETSQGSEDGKWLGYQFRMKAKARI